MPGFGPRAASRRRRASIVAPGSLGPLGLAVPSLPENTAAGTLVSTIAGRTAGSTLALTNDAGGRFALSGTNLLAGLTATNFETATSHTITIRESLASAPNSPRDSVLNVAVTNLFEAPGLGALSLSSTSYALASATSGTVTGATAGSTIVASGLPAGLTVNGAARIWAWSGSGSTGNTTITLTETLADSANSPRASPVGVTVSASGSAVGGVPIGSAGSGIYSGFTLSWGDDFTVLDIVGPNDPSGYLTNRGTLSMPGVRSGASAAHYYTDPQHTGYNDSGRGVAVITDTLSIAGGTRLKLLARKATAGEQAHFAPSSYGSGKPVICASAINTARKCLFYPGTSSGDMIVEGKIRHTAKAGNPAGWHPTLWTFSGAPTVEDTQDEWDIVEANSQAGYFNNNRWASAAPSVISSDGPFDTLDGTDHTYTLVMGRTETKLYIDGALSYTKATDSNTKNLPAYLILTNVVYLAGAYGGESFSEAAWTADADGAAMEVDWLRVWRKTGLPHYTPLTSVADTNLAYAGTSTIVLPSAATIWGDGSVTEYLQALTGEHNDPVDNVKFIQFPPGVSYNAGTRTITIDWTASSTPPGRLMFMLQAYKATGSTCEPLNFIANRGPKVTLASQSWPVGAAITPVDAYVAANVGNLLPKVLSVTGLPAGLSFSSSTGLITGTPSAVSSGNLAIQVTNCVGQTVTTNVAYAVGDATAPVLSSPVDSANGATGGTLSVSTNEGNGTLYWFVSTSGTPPTAANLKTGTGAVTAGNQAVTATGVQNAAPSGLSASTAYFAHFLHRDAAGNDSSIASADGFTTTSSWTPTSGALVDIDYEADRAHVNGTTYATVAAARTAGAVVQSGGIDRVPVSGFITSAYTLAGKGVTAATSALGQAARYLVALDDGADGAPIDELVIFTVSDIGGTPRFVAQVFDDGTAQQPVAPGFASTTSAGISTDCRMALSVAANDLAVSFDGATVLTDTVATLPTVTQLVVGNRDDGTRAWLGTVKRVVLLNTAVSDAALVDVLA